MKFTCPKCTTRYTISEDKIPAAAALKFSCKKCGNVIRVRRKEGEAPAQQSSAVPLGLGPTPVPSPTPFNEPAPQASTRVVSLAEINALKQASAQALSPFDSEDSGSASHKAPPAPSADEWFVLIAGKQTGPMPEVAVRGKLARGEIDERTYVWREGMSGWLRIAQVPALAQPATDLAKTTVAKVAPAPMQSHATVAMSASRLQEELMRVRGETSAEDTLAVGFDRQSTMVASSKNIEALLQAARVQEEQTQVAARRPEQSTMSKPSSQGPKDETKVTLDAGPDEDTLFGNFTEPAPSAVDSPFTSTVDSSSAVTLALSSDVVPEEARGTAPIGEATRVFMTSAGLYKRRRNNRLAGAVASVVVVGISSLLLLDVTGLYTVPFMGAVYEVTGIQDPNIVRAVSRVEEQLAEGDIAPEERAVLQKKLMGLQEKAKKKGIAIVKPTPQEAPAAAPTQGVVEKPTLNNDERALMAGLFNDERKKEATIKLIDPTDIQVPNLPDGLTQEAIYKVVSDNTRSMQLCLEESFKKGDKPPSKMEVELTIAADGTVKGADVLNARSSAMGACTVKRVKNWRFPRFNGEPVTVVFPYVLSQSF